MRVSASTWAVSALCAGAGLALASPIVLYNQRTTAISDLPPHSELMRRSKAFDQISIESVSTPFGSTDGPCDSPIYCHGPLLQAVQTAEIYPDSKTFVDKPTIKPYKQVLQAFQDLPTNYTKQDLIAFVNANFGQEGIEVKPVTPVDWHSDVKFLSKVNDPMLRQFASSVHTVWTELTRKHDDSELCEGCASSAIPQKNPFVVPGGRFREFYYWDSYWIFLGLVESEMFTTMKGMLDNYMEMVKTYGIVPNGSRIYYLNRSQPPMLIQMADLYITESKDVEAMKEWLPLLDREYDFWIKHRSVKVNGHTVQRFTVPHSGDVGYPRPESYHEDYKSVKLSNFTGARAATLYGDIAAAAESGWDFTARWTSGSHNQSEATENMALTTTSAIIPIDLNSIIHKNAKIMASYHTKAGNTAKAAYYQKQVVDKAAALKDLFWNPEVHRYTDYNLTSKANTELWSLASYFPFWSDVALPEETTTMCNDIDAGFSDVLSLLEQYPGGLPSTQLHTGLQWDFPNAWPPLQWTTIRALENGSQKAKTHGCPADLSNKLATAAVGVAQHYVDSVWCSWRKTGGSFPNLPPLDGFTGKGSIFEKFNATSLGRAGGGGEYGVQDGFGWTNGALLSLLSEYGGKLTASQC